MREVKTHETRGEKNLVKQYPFLNYLKQSKYVLKIFSFFDKHLINTDISH